MTMPARIIALTIALLAFPAVAPAQDQLLLQKDFDSLSGSEQWKFNDIWCMAAIDIASATPGYNNAKLKEAREAALGDYNVEDDSTDAELTANLAYATDFDKNLIAREAETLDQLLDGCVYDPKGPS